MNPKPIRSFVPVAVLSLIAAAVVSFDSPVTAQSATKQGDGEPRSARGVEPPLERDPDRNDRRGPGRFEIRSIDGSGNSLIDPAMNAAGEPLAREVPSAYGDGLATLAGQGRRSAREISNLVNDQAEEIPNPFGTSDFLWQWGQFLDHDIDLTEGVVPPEWVHIAVPAGDPFFDPDGSGEAVIFFGRSVYEPGSGVDAPREQLNEITGWIDASNVYGSDAERAEALRTLDGTGQLRTSEGDLLPWNDAGLPNATGGSSAPMFLAGDVRANEQVGLAAMHTLFVREHNRLAREIAEREPRLSGDEIYERARNHVAALMQHITYREFLPALLGPNPLPPYRGYDAVRQATILNEFSTAAYRFGHSALSPTLLRLDERLRETTDGNLPLREAFFDPTRITEEGGIEPILRGLAHQRHQRIDVRVIDDVRNFLFGEPGDGGFDLASLNIQRGRDHGLADYNTAREAFGLPRATDFSDVSSDPEVQARLAAAYDSIDDVDLWAGGLAEDAAGESQLGPLFTAILRQQFAALRDGDRFWYAGPFGSVERRVIEGTRLSDVIRRNTEIGDEIPDDVFHVAPRQDRGEGPDRRERPRRR